MSLQQVVRKALGAYSQIHEVDSGRVHKALLDETPTNRQATGLARQISDRTVAATIFLQRSRNKPNIVQIAKARYA